MSESMTYSEIEERLLLRIMQAPPESAPIVYGSTPVVSFGNGDARSKVWRGEFGDKIFLGWNFNIQRHETTERNKEDLTNWLKTQIF
jgi:hypothetical protein